MTIQEVLTKIRSDEINELFSELYGNLPEKVEAQKERYAHAVEAFTVAFPDPKELVSDTAVEDMRDISIFSAPGRRSAEITQITSGAESWRLLWIWMPLQ